MTEMITDTFDVIESAKAPDEYMSNYDGFREDWISTSALSLLMMCGQAFKFKYIDKIKEAIGVRQTSGSGAHKGREVNLSQKIESHEDLAVAEVQDATRDYVTEQFDSHDVQVEQDFAGKNKDQAKAICVDLATEFAAKDREVFQPEIQPAAVEESMAIRFPGLPRIVVGKLDVRLEDGTIRDLKTGKRAFGQSKADDSMGLTTYGMLKRADTGVAPPEYLIDNVSAGAKGCKTNIYSTTRTEVQLQQQLMRFVQWSKVIDAGLFGPCDPSHWKCGPAFCGFYDRCKFGGGK